MSAGSIIVIAFGMWVVVVGLVLALVRAAGRTDPENDPAVGPSHPHLRAIATAGTIRSSGRTLGRRLRTLADEDPSAARHAAAVARNALALARDAGLPRRDQEVAHTAGLLHDIGKDASLTAIPAVRHVLREGDRRTIRRHPVEGARLVREVSGFDPVADAVLSHHERLDGNGYPNGLQGDAIPCTARVVAVAEVYDVLTAPDSYKQRLTAEQALAELRRAAGTQLDAHLVEVFVTSVAGRLAADSPANADLETEIRRQHMAGELLDAHPRAS